jgi:hypothetical protein
MDNELVALIVEDMARQGFQCHMGPHYKAPGFFAQFYSPHVHAECDECGRSLHPDRWNDCGHGFTLLAAALEGREIALGLRPMPALNRFVFGL